MILKRDELEIVISIMIREIIDFVLQLYVLFFFAQSELWNIAIFGRVHTILTDSFSF